MPIEQNSETTIHRVLMIAGFLGATGVLLGAFTAHGLEDWLIDQGHADVAKKRVDQADVGVRYHLLHAAVLIGLAGLSKHYDRRKYLAIVVMMTAGTVLFSGSLYLLVALNLPVMGAITPLGGLTWIAAWVLTAMPCRSTCASQR